jgi:hypothetical protein
VPTISADVVKVPMPVVVEMVAGLPIAVTPSKNCTVPVGAEPVIVAGTVAVKVTAVPNVDGLSDEVSVGVAVDAFITCRTAEDVEEL